MTLDEFLKLPGAKVHDGGPCPVDPESRPDMLFMREDGQHWFSDGATSVKHWRAKMAEWSQCIAYREAP